MISHTKPIMLYPTNCNIVTITTPGTPSIPTISAVIQFRSIVNPKFVPIKLTTKIIIPPTNPLITNLIMSFIGNANSFNTINKIATPISIVTTHMLSCHF